MGKTFFKGYMKVKLENANLATAVGNIEMVGDWKTKSYRILSKPRRFGINFYFFNTQGEKAISSIQFMEVGNKEMLGEAIFQYANQMADENPEVEIDWSKSYAVVRA